MIWSWLAIMVLNMLNGILGKISADPSAVSSWLADPGDAAAFVVGKITPFAGFVPIGFMVTVVWVAVEYVLPIAFGVVAVQWLWDHIPHIGGTGT
jgi:hypothetical protein